MRCLFCVAVRGGLLDDADVYKLKRKVALGWRYQSRRLAFQDTQIRQILVNRLEYSLSLQQSMEVITLSMVSIYVIV